MTRQIKAASVSVVSNTCLLVLKTAVGLTTGSVGVLSAAADSLNDLTASVIALFSVRASARPADVEHPYGHGKIENISSAVQALLIFIAAVYIIYEAINRIVFPQPLTSPESGMAVMAVTAVVDLAVSRYLLRVADETDSAAIRADAYHLTTDVWASGGVFIALALVHLTGIKLFDPIVALIVAAAIIRVSVMLTMEAAGVLVDARLPEDEVREIETIVMKTPGVVGFHQLRARKSGPFRQIDFHLILPGQTSVADAHALSEVVEAAVHDRFPNTTIVTHIEPDSTIIVREPNTRLRRRQCTRRRHRVRPMARRRH